MLGKRLPLLWPVLCLCTTVILASGFPEEHQVVMLDETAAPPAAPRTALTPAKLGSTSMKQMERGMAQADEAALHISKRALKMEMLKLEPGFNKQMKQEQQQASVFAQSQSHLSQKVRASANQQAASPFKLSRSAEVTSEMRSEQGVLSAEDKKQAAAQAKPQTEAQAERGFEDKLSASDDAATHVSKAELEEAVEAMEAGMRPTKKQQLVAKHTDQQQLQYAAQQAGSEPSAAILSKAARQAKPLPVSTTIAAAQAQAPTLTTEQADLARSQVHGMVLSNKMEGAAVSQAAGMALRQNEEGMAVRQSQQRLRKEDERHAYLQSQMHVPSAVLGEASTQAEGQTLDARDKMYAAEQSYQHQNARDATAARDQARLPMHSKDMQSAAKQAAQTLSVASEHMAKQQALDSLSPQSEASAMVQAADPMLSRAQLGRARAQAAGAEYTNQVRKDAAAQSTDPLTQSELLAAQKQSSETISNRDQHAAQLQAQEESLTSSVQKAAAAQAQTPRYSRSEKEARVQAAGPHYAGQIPKFARDQAQAEKLDPRTRYAAWKQASNSLKPKDALAAKRQGEMTDAKKNMKFAADQADKMYHSANAQAVDNISKLTIKKRLAALKQVDDSLKHKDAQIAQKQALSPKYSASDKSLAKSQVFDRKLSKLRAKDEDYASKQTKSAFAGDISKADQQLAKKQAHDAAQKHHEFLSGYAAWKQKKREDKIKEKYASKLRQLEKKRESKSSVEDLGESQRITSSTKRLQDKPIPWGHYFEKLKQIRLKASQDVANVHQLSTNKN